MTRMVIVALAVVVVGCAAPAEQRQLATVEVYKSATCGCCSKWIDHLKSNGFAVRTTNREDLAEFKVSKQVPEHVRSCHTAVVNGYVIEGHVPAADVQRLLKERPAILGLAVRGMPVGSPGMEVEGARGEPFDVVAFDTGGQTRVFAGHGK